jgi:hypothetical protein
LEVTIEYEIDSENCHWEQINSKIHDWEQVHHEIRGWEMTIEYEIDRENRKIAIGSKSIMEFVIGG